MQTTRRARLAGAILPPPRCAKRPLLPPAPGLSAPLQQLPRSFKVAGCAHRVYFQATQSNCKLFNKQVYACTCPGGGSGTLQRQSAGHPECQAQKSAAAPQVGRVRRPEAVPGDTLVAAVLHLIHAPAETVCRTESSCASHGELRSVELQAGALLRLQRKVTSVDERTGQHTECQQQHSP